MTIWQPQPHPWLFVYINLIFQRKKNTRMLHNLYTDTLCPPVMCPLTLILFSWFRENNYIFFHVKYSLMNNMIFVYWFLAWSAWLYARITGPWPHFRDQRSRFSLSNTISIQLVNYKWYIEWLQRFHGSVIKIKFLWPTQYFRYYNSKRISILWVGNVFQVYKFDLEGSPDLGLIS